MHQDSSFSFEDAISAGISFSHFVSISPSLVPALIKPLIDVLFSAEYLERYKEDSSNGALYRVTQRRIIEMGELSQTYHSEYPLPNNFTERIENQFGERYEVVETIGKGGFATIYKAFDKKNGALIAIKSANQERQEFHQALANEAKILSMLSDKRIIKPLEFHETADSSYLILPYIDGFSLSLVSSHCVLLDDSEYIHISLMISEALLHIHDKGILWLDGKPGNVLITKGGGILLIDFGLSNIISTEEPRILAKTPEYASPEQLYGGSIGYEADIFSFGMIIFSMIHGNIPKRNEFGGIIPNDSIEPSTPLLIELEKIAKKCMRWPETQAFQAFSEVIFELRKISQPVIEKNIQAKLYEYSIHEKNALKSTNAATVLIESSKEENKISRLSDQAHNPISIIYDPISRFDDLLDEESHSSGESRTFIPNDWDTISNAITIPPALSTSPVTRFSDYDSSELVFSKEVTPNSSHSIDATKEPRVSLEITTGFEKIRREISGNTIKIGRGGDNTLKIDDPSISRYQCSIEWDGEGYMAKAFNSTNNTILNDYPLFAPSSIRVGDSLVIGKTQIKILEISSP